MFMDLPPPANRIAKYFGSDYIPYEARFHKDVHKDLAKFQGRKVTITYTARADFMDTQIHDTLESYTVTPVTVGREPDSVMTSGHNIIQLRLRKSGTAVFLDGAKDDFKSNTYAVGILKSIKLAR